MNQFNVYDIFGYVLPGALVIGVFLFGLSGVWVLPDLGGFGGSLALIIFAYISGHFLRASIGECIKPAKPSKWLLSDDNSPVVRPGKKQGTFTPEIKEAISRALSETFSPGRPLLPDAQQQYFDLAYALIIAKNCAGNVPIYNSLYALYRGLIAACWVSSFILTLFVLLSAALACALGRSPNWAWLVSSVVLVALLLYMAGWPKKDSDEVTEAGTAGPKGQDVPKSPLRKQLDNYAGAFSAGVYRNFLTWYRTRDNSLGTPAVGSPPTP